SARYRSRYRNQVGVGPEGKSNFFVLRTKEHFVELLPGSVIRKFEHATGELAAVLQHLAQLHVVERLGREEFLESLSLILEPMLGFISSDQMLQIAREVSRLERADPTFSVRIALNHLGMPRQVFVDRSNDAIDRRGERRAMIVLLQSEEDVTAINFFADFRQHHVIDSAD